jgi:hypothetical protein
MTRQPQLTDTQCLILSMASQREDGRIVLPGTIKGAAGPMVIGALERRGLVVAADLEPQPRRLMEGREPDLQPFLITAAGLAAIGLEPDPNSSLDFSGETREQPAAGDDREPATTEQGRPRNAPRRTSKREQLVSRLATPAGATTAALIAETGWLPHTLRAALSGLRKGGHRVIAFRTDAGEPAYRIEASRDEAVA